MRAVRIDQVATHLASRGRQLVASAAALLIFAVAAPPAALANAPTIEPLPVTARSTPFGALDPGVPPGVSEREYVLRGYARTFTDSGPAGAAPAYSTRVLVRKPAGWSGAVEVELLNNSAGFELPPMWDYQRDELARRGIAWMGVT